MLNLNDPIVPTDRAAIGDNSRNADEFEQHAARSRELIGAASAWLNLGDIQDQQTADLAEAFRKQLRDHARQCVEGLRKANEPHKWAMAENKQKWEPLSESAARLIGTMSEKLTAWLRKKDAEKAAALAAAKKAKDEAERRAALEADAAAEVMRKADRGELAGTGIHTAAALENAEAAAEALAKAEAEVEAIKASKVSAGGQFVVGGIKRAASLRTYRSIGFDLPDGASKAEQTRLIVEVVRSMCKRDASREDLMTEIRKIANRHWKATEQVPAGCKIVEEQRA